MPALLGTLGTCFMVLATPVQPERAPLILTGYGDIRLAQEVRDDVRWRLDPAIRNQAAEYRASSQYQIDQALTAEQVATRRAACLKDPKAFVCAPEMYMTAGPGGRSGQSTWESVQVIAAPDADCRRWR